MELKDYQFDKNQINITDEDTIDTVYNKFLAKLSSNRPNDIESKTTRYGIHKDDLNIFINDLDARLWWFKVNKELLQYH